MAWSNLPVAWQPEGSRESELPAAQIAGDLAHHEQVCETLVGRKRGWADSARRRPLEKAALVRERRDQATLSAAEQRAFKSGVQFLVDEGTYDALVRRRGDLAHNMFGSLGVSGLHRFLPWHRRYLWEFETELERADRRLRPGQLPLALPYWNWPDPFPDWLVDFLPLGEPAAPIACVEVRSGAACVGGVSAAISAHLERSPAGRSLGGPGGKPTADDVQLILHGFADQLPAAQVSEFVRFTYGLEGWGRRPDGSRLPAHNQVHAWVGGVMSQIYAAPADPICWLHMAQVDRLWSLWQSEHPGFGPALVGADQVLDPWPETVDDVRSPLALGYAYDR